MAKVLEYIQRHWQGELPLGLTVLVNLLAVRLILWLIPVGPAGSVFLALSGVVLVWQVVGGLRLASAGLRRNGDMFHALVVYSITLVVLVLTLAQTIDVISARFFRPPDLINYSPPILEMRDGGRLIVVSGNIDYGLNSSLLATLEIAPQARAVQLASEGGNIFAGRAMAWTILEFGLETQVQGDCFSACTIAFMAGEQRFLGPNGQLGFHGYAFDSTLRVQTLDVKEQEAKDRAFFVSRGVSPDFLDRVFATSPSDLWRPNRGELQAAGVLKP